VVGRAPVPGMEPTAIFTKDRITGTAGCNDYDGPYQDVDGVFSFPKFVSTAVNCAGAVGEVENLFYDAMRGVTSASIDPAGRLVIDGSGGSITFVAAPQPSPS
jgi:heat shock protein HslJ